MLGSGTQKTAQCPFGSAQGPESLPVIERKRPVIERSRDDTVYFLYTRGGEV